MFTPCVLCNLMTALSGHHWLLNKHGCLSGCVSESSNRTQSHSSQDANLGPKSRQQANRGWPRQKPEGKTSAVQGANQREEVRDDPWKRSSERAGWGPVASCWELKSWRGGDALKVEQVGEVQAAGSSPAAPRGRRCLGAR